MHVGLCSTKHIPPSHMTYYSICQHRFLEPSLLPGWDHYNSCTASQQTPAVVCQHTWYPHSHSTSPRPCRSQSPRCRCSPRPSTPAGRAHSHRTGVHEGRMCDGPLEVQIQRQIYCGEHLPDWDGSHTKANG